jgi:hypothetical protein
VPTIERLDPRPDIVVRAPAGFDLTALVRAVLALLILAIAGRSLVPVVVPRRAPVGLRYRR